MSSPSSPINKETMDASAAHLLTLGIAFITLVASIFKLATRRPCDRRKTPIKVSDASIARIALIDHADAFCNRPMPAFPAGRPVTHSIASMPYGPLWRALRCNLTSDMLNRSRLGILTSLEKEADAALVTNLSSLTCSDDVAVRNVLHSGVFALVSRLCFGEDGMDACDLSTLMKMQQEFFSSYVKVKQASERSWLTKLLHWRQRRLQTGMFDRIDEVFIPAIVAIRRRRLCQQDDNCNGGFRSYLDSLIELNVPDQEDGEHARRSRLLTDKEIAFLAWEFLGAGISGTVTSLEWTLAHLAVQPEIQNKLHDELAGDHASDVLRLPYLHAVVLESLRMHPPLPFASRQVVTAEGITAALGESSSVMIPPGGAAVSFVLGDIGRDGKVWTNPDEFRPERFMEGGEGEGVSLVPGPKEIKMMPFGVGRRHCLGVGMGMAHIKCFLAELVREFRWLLASPDDGGGNGGVDFTELDGFIKWMKTPLRVRITPRAR
ncbi:hypothetical protein HU200_067768 [Digitaria exilis]|uniref:Cytochrome P450 n=1 Tax=Digitaria exilis TaxID=1010633 RepID=A0A835A5G0_9POAL|nr:hypothetical protein HU200_067768 [Digitaria exilis]CAB3486427.1 unnamed protein product [Digitaria exilis]